MRGMHGDHGGLTNCRTWEICRINSSNGEPVSRNPHSQRYAEFGDDFAAIMTYLCQKGGSNE